MANIKTKDMSDLSLWTKKELRKLKMVSNNRISSLEGRGESKELPDTHPLKNMEPGQIKELILRIQKAEKDSK